MIQMFSRHLSKSLWAMGILLFFSLSILGCDSQDLGEKEEADDPIEQEDPTTVDRAVSEACAVCHATGAVAGVDLVHAADIGTITGSINSVEVETDGGGVFMRVLFSLRRNGEPVLGADPSSIRFTAAQLMPGVNGEASAWQSYINRMETRVAGDPGSTPVGFSAVQATAESASTDGGVFTDNFNGTYSYRFSFDFNSVMTQGAALYNADRTHRIAIQISDNVDNPYYDFRPSDGATTGISTRSIAVTSSCNDCHHNLGIHGGGRKAIEYCVTCHNPGSVDAHSGNTVDMKVMVHKIHMGASLPSVEAGEDYTIYGYRNSAHDYSNVHIPMDIRNCTECHDGGNAATPDGDNWRTAPTKEACGSCHDTISFEPLPVPADMTAHTGFPQDTNRNCAGCHPSDRIVSYHRIPQQVAAAAFSFNILSVENTAPGQQPEVTFSVTDPTNGDAPYDIRADAPFTAANGVSRLAVLIGWDTADYNNLGSESHPGQPISIDALAEATRNADGSFTVTSPVAIPADATGTGTAAIEGHPAADPDGDGVYNLRVPVTNVFKDFGITDEIPEPRRAVVDVEACNDCHGVLSLHGNNRTNEPQVCVICHNGNATDINQRPDDPTQTTDGRVEQAIDLKFVIHGIHGAGMRENPLVIYGYGGSEHAFGEIHYPGDAGNCVACHYAGTYDLPLPSTAQTTAVGTGDDITVPADDRYATPVTISCAACHDGELEAIHMQQHGGGFDLGPPVQPSDDDDDGDDGGEIFQPPGHPTSPNCTTAFECHG